MPCVPSIATSKPITLLSQLPSVHQKPTMQHWCLGLQLVIFVFNSLSPIQTKCDTPQLKTQPTTVKKRCCSPSPPSLARLHMGFLFFFFGKSRGERTVEQSAPIHSRPHPCGYLCGRTTQGFTCKLRDRCPVEGVTKDRSGVVIWAQYGSSLLGLLKARIRQQQGTLWLLNINHPRHIYLHVRWTAGKPHGSADTDTGLRQLPAMFVRQRGSQFSAVHIWFTTFLPWLKIVLWMMP